MSNLVSPEAIADLQSTFGDRLLLAEPLARHTSARIGGPADAFLEARTPEDLKQVARIAWKHAAPLWILGGGSNILISDEGVRGIVVHNRAEQVIIDGATVRAESGAGTIRLARQLAAHGLAGFEWAIGVPGTIGGAAVGNAGAHGGDMAQCMVSVEAVVPAGRDPWFAEAVWARNDLAYEYRSSIIKRERRPCVIMAVVMAFEHDEPAAIQARLESFNTYRKSTQPVGATIGSMFKNPPGDYAGRLIEQAGLKGLRIGGAQISEKHANFFLNSGTATASEVKALADLAATTVYNQSGIRLELEVELVGEWYTLPS